MSAGDGGQQDRVQVRTADSECVVQAATEVGHGRSEQRTTAHVPDVHPLDAYTRGAIADEQMAALNMAILLNGMDRAEISRWTAAMIASGERMDFSGLRRADGGVKATRELRHGPRALKMNPGFCRLAGVQAKRIRLTVD